MKLMVNSLIKLGILKERKRSRKLNGKLFNAFPTKQRGDSYATTSS